MKSTLIETIILGITAVVAAIAAFFSWRATLISKKANLINVVLELRKRFDGLADQMKILGEFRNRIIPNSHDRSLSYSEKKALNTAFNELNESERDYYNKIRRSVKGVFRGYEALISTGSISQKQARKLISKSSWRLVFSVLVPIEPRWSENNLEAESYYSSIKKLYRE